MKETYVIAELEMITFCASDIIAASDGLNYGGDLESSGGDSIDVGDLFQ